jgi:hypothetical protein
MWTLKNNEGNHIPATAENIIDFIESNSGLRISEEEERATEKRYLDQHGMIVKCYWDGKRNIIDLTPDYKN